MRIGIDARFYGSLGKGLGRYTEKLLHYLEQEEGDTHTYIVFLRRENFEEYQPTNPRFQKKIADFSWYGWREQLLFPWLLRKHQLDLVHFPHFNVPIFTRLPFIVTIHDLILLHHPTVKASELPPFLYWLKYLAYRFVIASAIRRARRIIAVSEFTRADIETTYPRARGKISVTLEAADLLCSWVAPTEETKFFATLGLSKELHADAQSPEVRYALYVGNAYPHKNLDLLRAVAQKMPDVLFLFVGKEDFFYRAFRGRCEREGLSNIRFLGYVEDRFLGTLYRHASAYVFPSLYEGFGLPGLEAMVYGLPVAAARAGSLPEIYGDAASYFDPNDADDCARAIREIMSGGVAETLRTRGFEKSAEYLWPRMAHETLSLYRKINTQKFPQKYA